MKLREPSYLRNCFLDRRPDDGPLFTSDGRPRMDGYAIIPVETHERYLGASKASDGPSFPCKLCGAAGPTAEGHDPCIANLPGVLHACCGHGRGPGYVVFADGQVLRGAFDPHPLLSAAGLEPS